MPYIPYTDEQKQLAGSEDLPIFLRMRGEKLVHVGREFKLVYPERGTCLYRCGNERYLLQVIAPAYKAALFGAAGGR